MISEDEKLEAWRLLALSISAEEIDDLSRGQRDYLLVKIHSYLHPGTAGAQMRTIWRRSNLALAVLICAAKYPDRSFERIYLNLANHYEVSGPLVKAAFLKYRAIEDFYDKTILADAELPHISFDNYIQE